MEPSQIGLGAILNDCGQCEEGGLPDVKMHGRVEIICKCCDFWVSANDIGHAIHLWNNNGVGKLQRAKYCRGREKSYKKMAFENYQAKKAFGARLAEIHDIVKTVMTQTEDGASEPKVYWRDLDLIEKYSIPRQDLQEEYAAFEGDDEEEDEWFNEYEAKYMVATAKLNRIARFIEDIDHPGEAAEKIYQIATDKEKISEQDLGVLKEPRELQKAITDVYEYNFIKAQLNTIANKLGKIIEQKEQSMFPTEMHTVWISMDTLKRLHALAKGEDEDIEEDLEGGEGPFKKEFLFGHKRQDYKESGEDEGGMVISVNVELPANTKAVGNIEPAVKGFFDAKQKQHKKHLNNIRSGGEMIREPEVGNGYEQAYKHDNGCLVWFSLVGEGIDSQEPQRPIEAENYKSRLKEIAGIIEDVCNRWIESEAPAPDASDEISLKEFRRIYKLATGEDEDFFHLEDRWEEAVRDFERLLKEGFSHYSGFFWSEEEPVNKAEFISHDGREEKASIKEVSGKTIHEAFVSDRVRLVFTNGSDLILTPDIHKEEGGVYQRPAIVTRFRSAGENAKAAKEKRSENIVENISDYNELDKNGNPNLHQIGLSWDFYRRVNQKYRDRAGIDTTAKQVAFLHLKFIAEDAWEEGEDCKWYIQTKREELECRRKLEFLDPDVKDLIRVELLNLESRLISHE